MNFVPPPFTASSGHAAPGIVGHWQALEDAARVVAALAAVDPSSPGDDDLPARLGRADPWRRERAEAALADLAAIMEPGLAALLAVNARGADPRPAAVALWREFAAARTGILALLPPRGA